MQNSELPFNASEQDNPDHRQIKTVLQRGLFLFGFGQCEEPTFSVRRERAEAVELLQNGDNH